MEKQEAKAKKLNESPFSGRSDGVRFPGQTFKKVDIITYQDVPEVIKTGEGKHDFYIKHKLIEVDRQDRKAVINSYKGDVGVLNIIKKVAISGQDLTSVVESGKFASKQKGLVDLSKLPDNQVDAYKAVEAGVKAFDNMPDDLKKKMSFAQFAGEMTDEKLQAYVDQKVQAKVSAIMAKKEKAEETKKESK